MEIGARLKEARIAKDISLDSLQDTTKIQKRYLLAIEEGNLQILPGKFYARAFIKEYANAVGLDPNELLEEYKEEVPKTEENDSDQYTRIQRSRKENNPAKSFSVIPTIIVVLLVIGIIFAAWLFYQKTLSNDSADPVEPTDENEIIYNPDDKDSNTEENTNTDDATTDDTAEERKTDDSTQDDAEPEAPQPELTVVEKGTASNPRSTLALENAGEEVKLVLESDGKPWLGVENADEKSLFSGFLTTDKSPLEFDVSGEEQLYFNIGDASVLTITIDGVEVEYPINPEEEVRQHLWINLNQAQDQTN